MVTSVPETLFLGFVKILGNVEGLKCSETLLWSLS